MYYFKQVKDGKMLSVEAKSGDVVSKNFVKATKDEYDNYIAQLPSLPSEPPRDLEAEIDEMKVRLEKLEKK